MKLVKKFGGLLLSLVLLMSMLSIVAFAEAEAPAGFPAGYEELEFEWTALNYYNSVKAEDKLSAAWDGSATYWYCTPKFTKDDLPNGTVIVAQIGTEYQAEGWVNGALTASKNRPAVVKVPVDATAVSYVVIDDAWWTVKEKVTTDAGTVYNPTDKVFTEIGFNVRVHPLLDVTPEDDGAGLKAKDPAKQAEITEKIEAGFKIYVPTSTGGGSGTTHTHAYGTTWKKDANNHWNECSCGDKANKAAHADANVDGKCDVCQYNIGSGSNNPQTGDNSMIALWVILLCVSACGIFVTTVYRKKSAF